MKTESELSPKERRCRIHVLLSTNEVVPLDALIDELKVKQATVYRDLRHMREKLGAPIDNTATKGYFYSSSGFTLPECKKHVGYDKSFSVMEPLIESLNENDLLGQGLGFLFSQTEGKQKKQAKNLKQRVRVVSHAEHQRDYEQARQHFPVIGQALLGEKRKRIKIDYTAKYSGGETQGRVVSPQQLVLYRGNWYLLAFCHLRNELRTFALEGISQASLLDIAAKELTPDILKTAIGNSYGFFPSRTGERTVTLRFSPERARWVSKERWHPDEKGHFEGEHYLLSFPYSDDRELIMDILRHVPEVEVVEPESLRDKVAEKLEAGLAKLRP